MKKLMTVLFAGLLLVAFTAPVFAWEFGMKGEYEYRFRYLGRTGPNDLFGKASVQNGPLPANLFDVGNPVVPIIPVGSAGLSFVGFAGPNIYGTGAAVTVPDDTPGTSGMFITRGGYSRYNSDALYDDQRLTLYPEIRVNPAIRVHGVYTVGGMRNKFFQRSGEVLNSNILGGVNTPVFGLGSGTPPFERYYMMNESLGAYNTAAIGSWEQVRATIQTPIAIFSIGVKDFPFGTGASLANHTRANAFLTVVPYGPFRFLHGIWLATGNSLTGHNTTPDSYTKNSMFQGALMTYDAADLTIGVGGIWQNYHRDAANPDRLVVVPPGAPPVPGTPIQSPAAFSPAWAAGHALDQNLSQYLIYFKYFNGRFFANAEYEWITVDAHQSYNTNTGLPLATAAPRFIEEYLLFTEAGLVCGPGKLSFMYGRSSGPVLNNGNRTKLFVAQGMNYQVTEPYNFLMFQTYGGGNQQFFNDGTGQMGDAFAYAGRLDYAIASNLNFFGTYMWAHRLEKNGVFKGHYSNTGAPASAASRTLFVTQNFGAAPGPGGINPYVDDGFIGWEANAGVDWKLLEGLTWNVRYAYWQPGDWFTQAYQALTPVAGGGSVGNGLLEGRDAIQAIHGSLMINF